MSIDKQQQQQQPKILDSRSLMQTIPREYQAEALLHARPLDLAAWLTAGRVAKPRHLQILSQLLTECALGVLPGGKRFLLVEMPPRHGKSVLVSHWFPVWFLSHWPDKRVVLASYEADFAASWGRRVRNSLQEYADDLDVAITDDSAAADRWELTEGGGMVCAGAGGSITGRGADLLIVDDPVKNQEEAYSETYRRRTWEWWQSTALTRLEPGGCVVIVQTRWHQDDLAGRIRAEQGQEVYPISLPAIAGLGDPIGRQPGAALWPDRYDCDALAKIKQAVGSTVWAALYQQTPVADGGEIVKPIWWRYYDNAPQCSHYLQSWDMAFKGTSDADYVVGQVWGLSGAGCYLLDQIRGRFTFPETVRAVGALSEKWPQATLKLIEDKANGPAVIDSLRHAVQGLVAVTPKGGKLARAQAVTPLIEAGNVYLPRLAPWVGDFTAEFAAFPLGKNDDQVDAATQALDRLSHMVASYVAPPTAPKESTNAWAQQYERKLAQKAQAADRKAWRLSRGFT